MWFFFQCSCVFLPVHRRSPLYIRRIDCSKIPGQPAEVKKITKYKLAAKETGSQGKKGKKSGGETVEDVAAEAKAW